MNKSDEQMIEKAHTIIEELDTLIQKGEYSNCLELSERLEDDYGDYIDTWVVKEWQALCHYHKADYQEALPLLEIVVRELRNLENQESKLFQTVCALGVSHYFLKQYSDATIYIDEALSLAAQLDDREDDISDYWLHIYNGRSLYVLRRPTEALESFMVAKKILLNSIDFQPEDKRQEKLAIVEFQIGKVYSFVEEYDKSQEQFLNVNLEHLPVDSHCNYFFHLGSLLYKECRYQAAIVEFNKMLKIGIPEGREAIIYFEMGSCFFKTNDFANAKKYFNMSLESETDYSEYHNYAEQGLLEVQKALKS